MEDLGTGADNVQELGDRGNSALGPHLKVHLAQELKLKINEEDHADASHLKERQRRDKTSIYVPL
jgi:hypothetical protein